MSPIRINLPIGRKNGGVRFVYSPSYWMVDLGRHVFPVQKYRLLYEEILRLGVRKEDLLEPLPADEEDLLRIHTPRYLRRLSSGRLSPSDIAALELPDSDQIYNFFRLMVGGSIIAAESALEAGVAVHIGGGFHHAFPDHGEGFCALNDVAVALETVRARGLVRRAMVVDCDVHQGNGTAASLAGRDDAFTFSLHQMDIYPAEKARSSMDVGLWSGDGDREYLTALRRHFPSLYTDFRPDLVLFVAGADPLKKDQLGGLDLTFEGLAERDRIVIGGARRLGIAVVVLLAGGYAADVADTVRVHLNTVKAALQARKESRRPGWKYFRKRLVGKKRTSSPT